MATLGEQAVGSIVKLNVGGVATNFIVVHQGLPGSMYDASCDGTWVMAEKTTSNAMKFGGSKHLYANSSMYTYLSTDFYALLDADVQGLIKDVKIPYKSKTASSTEVSSGADGLPVKIFCPSFAEVGVTEGEIEGYIAEGAALSYFAGGGNAKRIAYYSGTSKTAWWVRTPKVSNTSREVFYITDSGAPSNSTTSIQSARVRPVMVLPYDLTVDSDGTIVPASGAAITGQVNINGVQRELTGKGYINIGDVLRDLSDSQVNIGGILKSLKG